MGEKIVLGHLGHKKRTHSKFNTAAYLSNLHLVATGARPSFISEFVNLDDQQYALMLQEILKLPRFCAGLGKTGILNIDGDKFITNKTVCTSHLRRISAYIHSAISDHTFQRRSEDCVLPEFIDISKKLAEPITANPRDLETIAKTLSEIAGMINHATTKDGVVSVTMLTVPPDVNKCTLFGCLLGYPTIYYFDDLENCQNCLIMAPLKVIKVQYSSCTTVDDLFSFTYPVSLQHKLDENVNRWKRQILRHDRELFMAEDQVELPTVIL